MKRFLMRGFMLLMCAVCITAVEAKTRDVFDNYDAKSRYSLYGTSEDFDIDEDVIVTKAIVLQLPVELQSKNADTLAKRILMETVGSAEGDVQALLDEWTLTYEGYEDTPKLSVDAASGSVMFNWYDNMSGYVESFRNDILSYGITNEFYQGGNHPLYGLKYINYYIPSDEIMETSDLFSQSKQRTLARFIQKRAREQVNPEDASMINIEEVSDNFYVDNKGFLVFVYNPYEAGPWVLGVVKAAFAPAELEDYMTPKAKDIFLNPSRFE